MTKDTRKENVTSIRPADASFNVRTRIGQWMVAWTKQREDEKVPPLLTYWKLLRGR